MKPKKIVEKHIKAKVRTICAAQAMNDAQKAELVCELAGFDSMVEFLDGLKETAKGSLSQLQQEYKAFFMELLSKYGVSSPTDLDDKKKKEILPRGQGQVGDGRRRIKRQGYGAAAERKGKKPRKRKHPLAKQTGRNPRRKSKPQAASSNMLTWLKV